MHKNPDFIKKHISLYPKYISLKSYRERNKKRVNFRLRKKEMLKSPVELVSQYLNILRSHSTKLYLLENFDQNI